MGGMAGLMDKLPGMGNLPANVKDQANDKEVRRMIAIINSMTLEERRNPDIIKASRKRRIAAGCGLQVQDVNRLLKQHLQMSKMMKQFSKGGLRKLMGGMKGKLPMGGGGFPPMGGFPG
jgi:Signal recognition particle GTPase